MIHREKEGAACQRRSAVSRIRIGCTQHLALLNLSRVVVIVSQRVDALVAAAS